MNDHVSVSAAALLTSLQTFGAVRQTLGATVPDLASCQAAGLVRALDIARGNALIRLLIAGPRLRTASDQRCKPPTGQHALNAALTAELAARLVGAPISLSGIHRAMHQSSMRYDRRSHALAVVDGDVGHLHRVYQRAPSRTAAKLRVLAGEGTHCRLSIPSIETITIYVPQRHVARTRHALPDIGADVLHVCPWPQGWL